MEYSSELELHKLININFHCIFYSAMNFDDIFMLKGQVSISISIPHYINIIKYIVYY